MGAITAAAIGAATAIYSAKKSSDNQKAAAKASSSAASAADPYAPYRAQAATQLNALVSDPSSITNTATYKVGQQAAERTMAAQGYTGSGNAILASQEAAANSYQQEFNNLSALAGVSNGTALATSVNTNAANNATEGNAQTLSGYAGIANNLTNLATQVFNKPTVPVTPTTT